MLEVEAGEIVTRLEHENGEAKAFYAGQPVSSLPDGRWTAARTTPAAASASPGSSRKMSPSKGHEKEV
jgi:hypothetical protein